MERDINISMFDIRIAEMKTAWAKNRQELSACLLELVEELTEFQEGQETERTNKEEERVLIQVRRYCLQIDGTSGGGTQI